MLNFRNARIGAALVATVAVTSFSSAVADAHFDLMEPLCYSQQDPSGGPQKSAPCGQADPGSTVVPTGAVNAYVQGQMLTLTVNEVVFHPGHYRVSIAPTMAMLPADPPVTAGSTPCGTTTIETTPTMPVLADGVLVHTVAFSGPQTVQIPLPADFTCDHCVVQVVEFMSNHGLNVPGGCFYHHCANVTIAARTDGGGMTRDAETSGDGQVASDVTTVEDVVSSSDGTVANDVSMPAPDAGSTHDVAMDSGSSATHTTGCSCRTTPGSNTGLPVLTALALAGGLATRRRRRR